ncbi:MAG: pirin family protein [Bacteroidetes bacterium]|nr:pirin family protein [Bacteroidota bacterium]
MKTELHPASGRGHANHGWLDTYHNFSFADYFNPVRESFGALRVLNDDIILGGTGFGEHPHNNMEIISIPLSGELEHRDSMGHVEVISPGMVQVMSAGTGIRHSEYNHSKDKPTNFLQIWIYTRTRGLIPRYDQKSFDPADCINKIQNLVSPDDKPVQGSLWIHQDGWISITRLPSGSEIEYNLFKPGNLAFVFMINGKAGISGQVAGKRDAVGVSDANSFTISSIAESEVLIIEIPEN